MAAAPAATATTHPCPATAAEKLAGFLVSKDGQLPDGHWPRKWTASTGLDKQEREANGTVWMGDAPWPIIGLQAYYNRSIDAKIKPAITKGVAFLKMYVKSSGELTTPNAKTGVPEVVSSCEARAAVALALYETGEKAKADAVLSRTISECWDANLQLWKEATAHHRPVLFANTWMALLLSSVRPKESAKIGPPLSAIGRLLYTKGPGTHYGLDGVGPLAVWYEGTLSYIVAGGPGAPTLFEALKKQINKDGSINHYNDDFGSMGGNWAVKWSSLDGTSWLYYAAAGASPFSPLK